MAEPKPFSRSSGNLLKAPPPLPKGKKVIGVKAGSNEFQDAARNLENSGFRIKDGQLTPTQNYGPMVSLASEQRNSLSRDAKPGSISTLGSPLNSMYEANPGFFKRGPSGGAAVSPDLVRAQNIANAKEAGTFDIIRDQFNAKGGAQMNEFGTIGAAAPAPTAESVAAQRASIQGAAPAPAAASGGPITDQLINTASQNNVGPVKSPMRPAASGGPITDQIINGASQRPADTVKSPMRPPAAPSPTSSPVPAAPVPAAPVPTAPSEMDLNRQALEQRVAETRLQREASGELPTVTTAPNGNRTIQGKYGSGSATFSPSAATAAQRASIQAAAQAPMGPPLQGSAQMGPPLQGSAQMGPPSGASITAATPRVNPDLRALKELDSASAPAPAPAPMGANVDEAKSREPYRGPLAPNSLEQTKRDFPVESLRASMGGDYINRQLNNSIRQGRLAPLNQQAEGINSELGTLGKQVAADTATLEGGGIKGALSNAWLGISPARQKEVMRPVNQTTSVLGKGFENAGDRLKVLTAPDTFAKPTPSLSGRELLTSGVKNTPAPTPSPTSGANMVPSKDDITKQRKSLASPKR